jgi:hypothetical protein
MSNFEIEIEFSETPANDERIAELLLDILLGGEKLGS